MPRVKRGKTHVAKRKRLFAQTKGYRWGRKNTIRLAKTALFKAGVHAYRGRKVKKRVNRGLWQIQINAAVRPLGLSYSRFINLLKINKIELDRKVLAGLAQDHPTVFEKIVNEVKK
ncbi:MAG TPA: 50S ribosomal protein L20 [Patescibacteria group bacterium]|nr:50S ribosomal protein L20 [Patescibacteria group bacterium]